MDSLVACPIHGSTIECWRAALPAPFVTSNGLTAGEVYSVQANAVGAAGVSDWSDDAELMVV